MSEKPKHELNMTLLQTIHFSRAARTSYRKHFGPVAVSAAEGDKLGDLISSLATMTALCRLKYGNLDPDVYAEIQKAEQLLASLPTAASRQEQADEPKI